MQEVSIDETVDATVDSDYVRIQDELNGEVVLNQTQMTALMTAWVQQGGLHSEHEDKTDSVKECSNA